MRFTVCQIRKDRITEKEAMDAAKLYLSFMPKSINEIPPILKNNDPANRIDKT